MKREEIKVYYADLEGQLYEMDPFPGHDTATFIRKSEADKVMDALEAKINELGEDYRKISAMYIAEQTKAAKYEQRIKELEALLHTDNTSDIAGLMTLDEAITHCEEKAALCDVACGLEHVQLANWLKELRAVRKKREALQ